MAKEMNLKRAWSVLCEARKGNVISQGMWRQFADRNAMPLLDDPDCANLTSYEKLKAYHTKVWLMD